MATFFNSPNMNLVLPVPTLAPGPDWAQELNASLTIIDAHDHSAGNGVLITPSGLNINNDLSLQINNLTNVRSLRFNPNVTPIAASAPDLGALYEAGVDLYYNDGAGNQIRITQSGTVAGASGTITGLPSGTASASYVSAQGTFVFQQATATAANIDVASVIVRYPGSYPTPAGNFIVLEAPASLSSGYALTLPALPAQTNVMTLGTTGIISSVSFDQVGQSMTSVGADAIAQTMTPVGANAIANTRTRTVAASVGLGGVAVSTSSGFFTVGSIANVNVTNLSVTITTSGKPVRIELKGDGSGDNSYISAERSGSTSGNGKVLIRRNAAVTVSGYNFALLNNLGGTSGANFTPSSSIGAIDTVAAGTYTYTIQVRSDNAAVIMTVSNTILVAYEL